MHCALSGLSHKCYAINSSQSFMAHLDAQAETCGYANYTATHLTYPPTGLLPLPGNSTRGIRGCDVWDEIFDAALLVNPAFNIYRIYDTVSNVDRIFRYEITDPGDSSPFYGMFLASRTHLHSLSYPNLDEAYLLFLSGGPLNKPSYPRCILTART